MSEDRDDPGFTVRDRRRLDAEGRPRADGADDDVPSRMSGATDASESAAEAPLPEVDFSTFVLSLSTSAMVHLGEATPPDGGSVDKNLPLAQQVIDILALLQSKTTGNLTPEESKLLEELLYDLRLRYVRAAR